MKTELSSTIEKPILHPYNDENDRPVVIQIPYNDSSVESWNNPFSIAHITPGSLILPKKLNNIPFNRPKIPENWNDVGGQGHFEEPEFKCSKGKKPASGVIIHEPDGRIWAVSPTNKFGGYKNIIGPKGRIEQGLNIRANAIKEAMEETGLQVHLLGYAFDYCGSTTYTRYYHGIRVGGDPSNMGWESQRISLVPIQYLWDHLDPQPNYSKNVIQILNCYIIIPYKYD